MTSLIWHQEATVCNNNWSKWISVVLFTQMSLKFLNLNLCTVKLRTANPEQFRHLILRHTSNASLEMAQSCYERNSRWEHNQTSYLYLFLMHAFIYLFICSELQINYLKNPCTSAVATKNKDSALLHHFFQRRGLKWGLNSFRISLHLAE